MIAFWISKSRLYIHIIEDFDHYKYNIIYCFWFKSFEYVEYITKN